MLQIDQSLAKTGCAPSQALQGPRAPLAVLLIDDSLSCSLEQLWSIICQPDPHFQATIHRLSGNRDIQQSSWTQKDGVLSREETYINPLKKNSLGPKEAYCIDQQQCLHRSPTGFILERKVFTPKVPFGGSFYNKVLWSAWSRPGSLQVHLQVSCDIIYTSRWVPAKGIINSSSFEGMQRFYKMWLEQLQASIHALGGATKPASRGTQRHQVSLLADSAVSSRSFMAPKPLAITSSMISFPVMVVLLGLFLWLLYSNVVLLRRQDMLPRGMLSQAGNLLPPLVPQPSVITENCRLVSESCCL